MIPQALPEQTLLQGRYRLEAPMTRGGSSILYFAKDGDCTVVVKECFVPQWMTRSQDGTVVPLPSHIADMPAALDAFRLEGELLRRCGNVPGLVNLLDVFNANGTAYLVLEYIPGETLRTALREKDVPLSNRIAWLKSLAETLEQMHRAGVLQLDLNPDNVLVTANGSVRLVDLGGGYLLGQRPAVVQAQNAYAAPELYTLEALTERTDLYGFSAMAYEVLTGRQPDSAGARLLEDTLIPPDAYTSEVPKALSQAVMMGLNLAACDRAVTLPQLIEVLRRSGARVAGRRKVRIGLVAAAAAVVIFAALAWLLREPPVWYEAMDTETFSVRADHRMGEDDIAEVTETLEQRLAAFTGDQYLLRQEDGYWIATVPLAAFGETSVRQTLEDQFSISWEGITLAQSFQPQVEWTSGDLSMDVEQIWTWYTTSSDYNEMQWNTIHEDLRNELEALAIPYRLGNLEHDPHYPVLAIAKEHYDEELIQGIFGGSVALFAVGREEEEPMLLINLTEEEITVSEVDGQQTLQFQFQNTWHQEALEELSQEALAEPTQEIGLGFYSLFYMTPRFIGSVDHVISDGRLTLTLCPDQLPHLGDFLKYVAAGRGVDDLLSQRGMIYLPEGQNSLSDVNPALLEYDSDLESDDPLDIAAETLSQMGISCMYDTRVDQRGFQIYLNFSMEGDWIQRSTEVIAQLAQLPEIQAIDCPIIILVPTTDDLNNGNSYSVLLVNYNNQRYLYPGVDGSGVEPYLEEIRQVWEDTVIGGWEILINL